MKSGDLSSPFIVNKLALDDSYSRGTVKKYLEKKKFTSVVPLDCGGFGAILSAVTPKNENVAIKIIKNTFSWEMEELIWPALNHPNILPLYDVIELKEASLKLYFMPKHPNSLNKMIRSSEFLTDPDGLKRIRKWLQNTAEGLQYLHHKGFVHLDVKSDNVLITAEDIAVLCDFSGINLKKQSYRRLVAPSMYRPPESFRVSAKHKVDGVAFDIWTYALMSLHVLTGNWPASYLRDVYDYRTWETIVQQVLKKFLEEVYFYKIIKLSLPSVSITDEDLKLAHDFISAMMQWDPKNRPTAHQILEHPFLLDKYCPKETLLGEKNEMVECVNTTEKNPVSVGLSSKCDKADSILSVQKLGAAPDQNATPKKKKNAGIRIKGWLTKQFNRSLKGARKNCAMLIDNISEGHWAEHWILYPRYC